MNHKNNNSKSGIRKLKTIHIVGVLILLGTGIFISSFFINQSPFSNPTNKIAEGINEKTDAASNNEKQEKNTSSTIVNNSNSKTIHAANNQNYTNSLSSSSPITLTSKLNKKFYSKEKSSSPLNSNIMLSIAKREYTIQYQKSVNALQSPNRKQNLRITYHPDGFEAKARKDSAENWNIAFKIKGIYKGDVNVLKPSLNAVEKLEKNKLVYKHPGFHIEYVNDDNGMRQNFIVQNKPEGNAPLKVIMNVNANGLKLTCKENAITTIYNGKKRYSYSDLKVWDANHKKLNAQMNLEGDLLALVIDDKNAEYPVTIDPLSCNWSDEGNQDGAEYGFRIAIGNFNGDDYDDLLVGAHSYDNGTTDEGMVFLYDGSENGLEVAESWTAESNQGNWPIFGGGGLAAGDVNGDGYDDIMIGAYQWDFDGGAGHDNEGRAWVYFGSASGPDGTADWTYSTASTGSFFGFCIAAGDINNDGYDDMVIGAEAQSNGESYEGKAYIFNGSASGPSASPDWSTESNQANALYGYSAACSDVNGDGYDDVLIGAKDYANGQAAEGKMFLYYGSSSGASTSADWTYECNQANASLGVAASTAGDVNNDGYEDVLFSAHLYDNGNTNEGIVYLFYGSSTGLASTADWTQEGNQDNAHFGWLGVKGGGDVNGDGYDDVVIGAPRYDNGETDEGIVYLFLGSGAGIGTYNSNTRISSTPDWSMESNQASARFGVSAAFGDVDGDGFMDALFGAQRYVNGNATEGAVFQYYGDDSAPLDYRAPLPIKLISFTGECEGGITSFKWETASETNNDFFTIEHSPNGTQWEQIATIKGAGNSNSKLSYSHSTESKEGNNYYRLKQTDFDGKFEYFKIINVNCELLDSKEVVIYPNPSSTGRFNVSGVQGNGTMVIYNAIGETIFKMISLSNSMDIDLSNYPKGTYSVVISTGSKNISRKIVISR